ncbi:MAG TPA: acetyl-CoA carboxylase biotin carboxyl carrier protein [Chloroflexota bacterium]|nr:acetyl-CoA carboxylase biotin carboxyl carrier protein [Chloroflexota bacterium]
MTNDADARRAPDEELIRSLWQEARDLIKRLEGSSVQRLAIQAGEYKIEIERGLAAVAAVPSGAPPLVSPGAGAPGVSDGTSIADDLAAIVAPLVGTFYRSPQPGAKPFVEEGTVVEKGQPVCIVEAMKIMNQVVADRKGRVAEIVANEGDWVEFQQVLLYLEPIEE